MNELVDALATGDAILNREGAKALYSLMIDAARDAVVTYLDAVEAASHRVIDEADADDIAACVRVVTKFAPVFEEAGDALAHNLDAIGTQFGHRFDDLVGDKSPAEFFLGMTNGHAPEEA